MPEQLDQAALDVLGDHVLPPAGLGVHQLPVQPDDVGEQPLGEPVLAHHPRGEPQTLVGQLQVAVPLDGEQAVTLHPGHRLADRGPALVQPLGDPRTQRDDALLLQLEDRAEVHLGGVDQVAHADIVYQLRPPLAELTAMTSSLAPCRDVVPARPPAPATIPRCSRPARRAVRCWRCSWWTRRCGSRPAPPAGPTWSRRCGRSTPRSAGGSWSATGTRCVVVPAVAAEVGAGSVHVAADFGPYGRRRDTAVEETLAAAGVELRRRARPTRSRPARVVNARRRGLPGLHAVLAGVGRPRPARTRRPPARGRPLGGRVVRPRPVGARARRG